jgi:hypothetical protein
MRNFGLKCIASGRSRIGVPLAIIVVVIVAFAYSPTPDRLKLRGPNPHETFYQFPATASRRYLHEGEAKMFHVKHFRGVFAGKRFTLVRWDRMRT